MDMALIFCRIFDLPCLSTHGFRLSASLLPQGYRTALEGCYRASLAAKTCTEELSGPADDPLCLIGLWLLASVVAPQMVSLFESSE